MQGEKVAEFKGNVTGQRFLPSNESGSVVEVSVQAGGTILGNEATLMATYDVVIRPDGTLDGQGQGVVLTPEGDMATAKGQGAGRFTGHGAANSFRGALCFHTASQKLARLNGMATAFEWDVDENGNLVVSLWELK